MRVFRAVAGIVCLLVGIVWIGQGLGLIRGSVMTGHPQWSVAGFALVVIALALFASLRFAAARQSP